MTAHHEHFPAAHDDPLAVPLAQLRRRTSEKWLAYPPAVLPLWVAEMDSAPVPAVVAAVEAALRLGDTGYQHGPRYIEAHADFARDRWGWDYAPAQAVMAPDTMVAMVGLTRQLLPRGGRVVVCAPVYPPFLSYPVQAGFEVVRAQVTSAGRIDAASLDEAMTVATADGADAVMWLCNPHNPTGTVHTAAELAMVADLGRRHGVAIVADEIHAPVTYVPFTPLLTVADDAFAVVSASKAWNLAGLRAASIVAGQARVDTLRALPWTVTDATSHLSIIAHEAAFTHGRDWLDALLVSLAHRRALLADLLAAELPQLRYREPDGTYLAWLDCRELTFADGSPVGPHPSRVFLKQGDVALQRGSSFGADGGFARLNFATSPQILAEAVARMRSALGW